MNKEVNRAGVIWRILALVALIIPLEIPIGWHTHLWNAVSSAGHVPLFGLMSLLILGLLSDLFGSKITSCYLQYALALGVTICLGGATELLQPLVQRDADIADVFRDAAGALAFLCFYATLDPELRNSFRSGRNALKAVVRIFAIMIVIIPGFPALEWSRAYWHRNSIFPVICAFSSKQEIMFLETKKAKLSIGPAPGEWKPDDTDLVGKVTFEPATYPGFGCDEPYPDWSRFQYFTFEAFSDLSDGIDLTLRIEDSHHNQEYSDRYNYIITVNPGFNRISVPLDEVRKAPHTRQMDMKKIAMFSLFAHKPQAPFSLYFDNFVLK